MSLKDMQKDVHEWTGQFTPQYWPPADMMLRLTEETGEVAREINHLHGSKKKKDSEDTQGLEDELIDVLFTVSCIANQGGIDLQEAWERVMKDKHWGRDNERYKRKDEEI